METTTVKLPIHKHPLYPSSQFTYTHCDGCNESGFIYGGYRCNDLECDRVWFHKECAESPQELNHTSHPEHSLVLTDYTKKRHTCDCCGKAWLRRGYRCSICDFDVDTACARNPPSLTIEHPKSHDHPLVLLKTPYYGGDCGFCKETIYSSDGYPYYCPECYVSFHNGCVDLTREINHPFHPHHRLTLMATKSFHMACKSLPDDADKTCLICGLDSMVLVYHCSVCNFTMCLACIRNSPPLAIDHPKTHDHQLKLFTRRISFTCHICGMQGYLSPYLCVQCGFSVHRECIDLPRVIHINRHDHRIYYTHHLGPGFNDCGVCRKSVNQYYGAYYCPRCPHRAFHSLCATSGDVWDGIELEGSPEDTEDIASFEVVGENMIKHFSHENHVLILNKDGTIRDESARCEACILPVYSDPIYSCEHCDFNLHESCANLPRKKRLVYNNKPFTLLASGIMSSSSAFECSGCGVLSSGFRYVSGSYNIVDVRCAMISEPFVNHDHSHPLYHAKSYNPLCVACHHETAQRSVLSCDTCHIYLDLRCANLPKLVKHKLDKHPLSLSHGDDPSDKYWCDICETKTNPSKWFYTSDCGMTLHVKCVLGDFFHVMPGRVMVFEGLRFEVVSNDKSSRPFCIICKSRCKVSFIVKVPSWRWASICSRECFEMLTVK